MWYVHDVSTPDDDTPARVWLPGTTIRLQPDVRAALDRFAHLNRWSLNVAVDVLVTEALTARGIPIGEPEDQA